MKKSNFIFGIIYFFIFAPVFAQGFRLRNSTDINYIKYSNDRYILRIENTSLFPLHEKFIPEIRFIAAKTEYGEWLIPQPGFVWIIARGLYAEVAYGLSINTDGISGQEGFSEITWETNRFITSAYMKAGFNSDTEIFFLTSNTAFRYLFSPIYSTKIKYYLGYSTDSFYSHTVQLENIATINDSSSLALITTGVKQTTNERSDYLWSAGLRFEGRLTNWFLLKYIIQYHTQPYAVWSLENGITVDVLLR